MSHRTVRLFAPAKINLFLHITGKQQDGYHTLQSLMGFVDVGDELEISPYDGLYFDASGPFADQLADPKDNLVYKAALLLSAHYKVSPQAKMTLTKNLPIASGIGGGSSDAAAALKGLAKLWGLPDEARVLAQIGQQVGADVPACLYKKLVWVEGIGEKLTRLPDIPDFHFVLANPLIPTPTAEVFRALGDRFSPPLKFSGRRKTANEWIADLKIYHNDLTDPAMRVTPEIGDVLHALSETSGCLLHRLSGSGATCFGLYKDAEAARLAAHKIKTEHRDWWVTPANLLK